ncbi:hypothetical protein C8A01DRAFT_12443 [Parachaetomium inaequale]|uniref:Uncharacterized protein n=1 Tax=Parachaetomium inaequale TaxID=2588326 RepID=A0AAN6SW09_9PEZI|nr:hypothetical protein C8A01DRAFT_12443 [Parachaetomium inaequale]
MAPTDTFTITANPGTDIWRKPPTTDVFNAPTALPPPGPHPLRASGPLSAFLSARLSFTFTPQEQYDQGGILLSFRRRPNSPSSDAPPPQWIKSGVEFYNGLPRLSTVACERWADWSVADLDSSPSSSSKGGKGVETGWTTILVEKDRDGNGTSLWVYRVVEETGEKVPLREICWVFADRGEEEDWVVEVHAMAARPEKAVEGGLEVEFRGLDVKWAE